MRLANKIAIVTGASRGIGKAVAIGFAKEGANVVVVSNSQSAAGEAVVNEIKNIGRDAIYITCDISKEDDVKRMVEKSVEYFGHIDILVNNAGICPFHEFLTMPLDLWEKVTDTNQKGTFLCSQTVAKHMVEQNIQGRIISTSSISSWVGGGEQVHYTPTKAAIENMMKSMAIVLGPKGITCNSVLPGAIETDINKDDFADPKKRQYLIDRTPVRRLGRPEDVVGAYVFLASEDASYITGSSILVDGGMFVNLQ